MLRFNTSTTVTTAAAAAATTGENIATPATSNPDAVIAGAGPAGLLVAIQAALDGVRVLLVEKRELYLRSHALALNPDSFPKNHPKKISNHQVLAR